MIFITITIIKYDTFIKKFITITIIKCDTFIKKLVSPAERLPNTDNSQVVSIDIFLHLCLLLIEF